MISPAPCGRLVWYALIACSIECSEVQAVSVLKNHMNDFLLVMKILYTSFSFMYNTLYADCHIKEV